MIFTSIAMYFAAIWFSTRLRAYFLAEVLGLKGIGYGGLVIALCVTFVYVVALTAVHTRARDWTLERLTTY